MIRRLRRDETGLTLIELLVVSLLLALVLGIIASIYLSTVRTQSNVGDVTRAATDAQSAVGAIDRAVRTSTEVHVKGPGDRMAIARVPGSGTTVTWTCRAWYFDPTGKGRIYTRSFSDGATITVPTSTTVTSWTLLIEGVKTRGGSTIFGLDGDKLTVAFEATAAGHPPVTIDLTTTPLTSAELETSLCS